MSKRLQFKVQGSAPEPYVVTFARSGDHLHATCTCKAGLIGQYCKHRFNLLAGEVTGLVSENSVQVNELPAMLAGSDVELALQQVADALLEAETAKNRLQERRHELAWIMTSDVMLNVGISGTGIEQGQRGKVAYRQERGPSAGEKGTTLSIKAVQVKLINGGEVWMRPDEITEDVPDGM